MHFGVLQVVRICVCSLLKLQPFIKLTAGSLLANGVVNGLVNGRANVLVNGLAKNVASSLANDLANDLANSLMNFTGASILETVSSRSSEQLDLNTV